MEIDFEEFSLATLVNALRLCGATPVSTQLVVDIAAPFLLMAEEEEHLELSPVDEIDKAEVADAISSTFGLAIEARDILVVSASAGLAGLPDDYRHGLIIDTVRSFFGIVRTRDFAAMDRDTWETLVFEAYGTAGKWLQSDLAADLSPFAEALPVPGTFDTLTFVPAMALVYLLAYAVSNDRERMLDVGKFLAVCRKALPHGELAAEPGRWVVVAR